MTRFSAPPDRYFAVLHSGQVSLAVVIIKLPLDFLPYKPGGCLKSCVSHPITNAMIENGCSLVCPPWGRESNSSHAKHGMVIDAHPVASAPCKALKCFCHYPHGADKFN